MRFFLVSCALALCLLSGCVAVRAPRHSHEQARLRRQLDSIHLARFDFTNAPLQTVIDYLVEQSVLADPEGRGIPLSVPYPDDLDCQVSARAQNISFREAIEAINVSTALRYDIGDYSIALQSCHVISGPLTTRAFKVSEQTLATLMSKLSQQDLKKAFIECGVPFPEDRGESRISYNPSTELLTVSNEPEALDRLEACLDALAKSSDASR